MLRPHILMLTRSPLFWQLTKACSGPQFSLIGISYTSTSSSSSHSSEAPFTKVTKLLQQSTSTLILSPSVNLHPQVKGRYYHEVSRADVGLVEGRIVMVPTRQGALLRIVLVVLIDRIQPLVQASSAVIEVAIFYHALNAKPKAYRLPIALHLIDGEDHGSVDWIERRFQQANRISSDSTYPGHTLLAIRKREVGVALTVSAELAHEVLWLGDGEAGKGGIQAFYALIACGQGLIQLGPEGFHAGVHDSLGLVEVAKRDIFVLLHLLEEGSDLGRRKVYIKFLHQRLMGIDCKRMIDLGVILLNPILTGANQPNDLILHFLQLLNPSLAYMQEILFRLVELLNNRVLVGVASVDLQLLLHHLLEACQTDQFVLGMLLVHAPQAAEPLFGALGLKAGEDDGERRVAGAGMSHIKDLRLLGRKEMQLGLAQRYGWTASKYIDMGFKVKGKGGTILKNVKSQRQRKSRNRDPVKGQRRAFRANAAEPKGQLTGFPYFQQDPAALRTANLSKQAAIGPHGATLVGKDQLPPPALPAHPWPKALQQTQRAVLERGLFPRRTANPKPVPASPG